MTTKSDFSAKIRLRHFSTLGTGLFVAKNQKKVMTGSMRTFVTDGRTDGLTGRQTGIGPKCGYKKRVAFKQFPTIFTAQQLLTA